MPVREGQVRLASGTIKKSKISLPTELISTTNLLAYTAPDLPSHAKKPSSKSASSSTASFRSGGDDSDMNTSTRGSSTPATSPDTMSLDVSPISPESTQHTTYFDTIKRSNTTHSSTLSRSSTSSSANITPAVPQRALSHTKKSHQELARQRSRSKMAPPSTSISNMHASRMNQEQENRRQLDMNPHPFGKELEQVNEVAEEFGAMMGDDEERALLSKGFFKFSTEDYLLEIQDLHDSIFGSKPRPALKAWI